jgi:putative tryptophan/tyrosine transport system substrate-binding protein
MRRRDFIGLASVAAVAWPLAARAQQTVMPVIGFLGGASADRYVIRMVAFHKGLMDAGYVEGKNVAIEYRWAEGNYGRLPAFVAELIQRQVNVLVSAGGAPAALAAKAATTTVPIVFVLASDPVEIGLVASLNRPDGNLTGVTDLNVEVGPKRLEIIRELLPAATTIGVLVNPTNPEIAVPFARALKAAASTLGITFHLLQASTDSELEAAFATLDQLRADALVISPDIFFNTRSAQLASLSLRHTLPAIFQHREFVAAGGLIGYGSDETENYRLLGTYTGKILKGDKPADLPVVQSTKVELLLNFKTAKALGITVPLALSGRADEVIE